MEPYLIMLQVTNTDDGFVLLSYIDPKPPNYKHFGHNITLDALEQIFKRIGLNSNIPELYKGKQIVEIEIAANEARLTALGFNEIGENITP